MEPNRFYQKVYDVARQVPTGRVTTYGAIAAYIGGGTARMAGHAMPMDKGVLPPVPAHRIVNHAGRLSGHSASGIRTRSEMLDNEGIIIQNNRIANFKKVFWDPSVELPK
jgi:methylated-DNA-protein-cysteine methyltransferase-like protein